MGWEDVLLADFQEELIREMVELLGVGVGGSDSPVVIGFSNVSNIADVESKVVHFDAFSGWRRK